MLLQLVTELSEADAQKLGRTGLNASGARECHLELAVLDLIGRRLQFETVGRNLDGDFLGGAGLV